MSKPVLYRRFHSVGITLRNVTKKYKSPAYPNKYKSKFPSNDVLTIPWRVGRGLNQNDIDIINDTFLKRTSGLEPDTTVKQLAEISKEFHERFKVRYLDPSKQWSQQLASHGVSNLYSLPDEQLLSNYTFNYNTLWNIPLQIGDLVLLTSRHHELSMCVGLPHSIEDPRYTFVTGNGSIIFNPRNQIQLRIPYRISENIHSIVQKEPSSEFKSIGTIRDKIGETLVLPHIVRKNVTSEPTSRITKDAWFKLPLIIKKLKLINRYLQKNDKSYEVSFVQLVNLVEKSDLNKYNNTEYFQSLLKDENETKNINASTFLATYWGVKEQQLFNMWGDINSNSSILSPVSVTVLPIQSRQVFYDDLLKFLLNDNYKNIETITTLINKGQYGKVCQEYPQILTLLLDYSAGNFVKNLKGNPIITILSTLFRNLSKYQDKDITRDACFKLLTEICPSYKEVNPIHHNLHLTSKVDESKLPFELYKHDLTATIFPTSKELSQTYKQVNEKRVDYTNLPVYCIDSEVAHEIDDGISITKKDDKNYRIFIHIADPVSSFPESIIGNEISSPILKIASDKAFTTYLPDMVDPMLPKSITQSTGMGVQDKKTKAITFSVDVKSIGKNRFSMVESSFRIELTHVSDFPKVTYNIVDEILTNDDYPVSENVKQDLKMMSNIAMSLKNNRVYFNNAIIFGEGFNKGLVQLDRNESNVPMVNFKDQKESPSTTLVSEFMILANKLTGKYFTLNDIPGVFRCYKDLPLGPQAFNSYSKLQQETKKGHTPDIQDIVKVSSLLNAGIYSSKPLPHKMIGALSYLTVTSPLRRMPDLINHIQLHRHLNQLDLAFTKEDIDSMLWNIQSRADIIKSLANTVSSYWTLKYLKDQISKTPEHKFEVMVTSYPFDGKVLCVFPEMSFARGSLKVPTDIPHPKIGTLVKNCKITNIDCLENNLELEIAS
ncbi:hypothetical protein C6P44_002618 [Monosporozyma unispora]|nr:hypothetical protein C6P44_002618 [Kazachstania unispora]